MVDYGIRGLKSLLDANPETKVTISTTPKWEAVFREAFPDAEVIV
jgi:hypothetical protein